MNDQAVNGQRSSRKNFQMEEQLEQSLRGTEGVQDFVPTRLGKVVSYSDPPEAPGHAPAMHKPILVLPTSINHAISPISYAREGSHFGLPFSSIATSPLDDTLAVSAHQIPLGSHAHSYSCFLSMGNSKTSLSYTEKGCPQRAKEG